MEVHFKMVNLSRMPPESTPYTTFDNISFFYLQLNCFIPLSFCAYLGTKHLFIRVFESEDYELYDDSGNVMTQDDIDEYIELYGFKQYQQLHKDIHIFYPTFSFTFSIYIISYSMYLIIF